MIPEGNAHFQFLMAVRAVECPHGPAQFLAAAANIPHMNSLRHPASASGKIPVLTGQLPVIELFIFDIPVLPQFPDGYEESRTIPVRSFHGPVRARIGR